MKKLLYIISVIITAALLSAACRRNLDPTLSRAEALMDSHPDSALAMLRTDSIRLAHEPLFALLYTQAQIKTYKNVTDDSLISVAVEYYSGKSNKYYNMLANYYLGCIKYNAGEYAEAIAAMYAALENANPEKDFFWLGLINRVISNSYNAAYNYKEELNYSRRQYAYFKKSGRQPHIDYALCDLARAYSNAEKFDSAIIVSSEVLDSAQAHENLKLYLEAVRLQAVAYFSKDDYNKSIDILKDLCESEYATDVDSAYLGVSYIFTDRIDRAAPLVEMHSDTLLVLGLKNLFYKQNGQLDKAWEALDKFTSKIERELYNEKSNDLSSELVTQLVSSKQLAESNAKSQQLTNILLSVIFVLIAIISVILFNFYKRRQRTILENKIQLIEQLRNLVNLQKKDADQAKVTINSLFHSKYDWLDNICSELYEKKNTKALRNKISNAIETVIEQIFNNPVKIQQMEELLNIHYHGMFDDFKTDFPYLQETDYLLYLLSALGFSNNSIAVILRKDNVTYIYNKRRHLKDKIKAKGEFFSNKYLPLLNN